MHIPFLWSPLWKVCVSHRLICINRRAIRKSSRTLRPRSRSRRSWRLSPSVVSCFERRLTFLICKDVRLWGCLRPTGWGRVKPWEDATSSSRTKWLREFDWCCRRTVALCLVFKHAHFLGSVLLISVFLIDGVECFYELIVDEGISNSSQPIQRPTFSVKELSQQERPSKKKLVPT